MSGKKEWTFEGHRARVGDDESILFVEIDGNWGGPQNDWLTEVGLELAEIAPQPLFCILNTEKIKIELSKETRKRMLPAMKAHSEIFGKRSIVGTPPAMRVFAKVLVKLGGKGANLAIHDSNEQALAWFKE